MMNREDGERGEGGEGRGGGGGGERRGGEVGVPAQR